MEVPDPDPKRKRKPKGNDAQPSLFDTGQDHRQARNSDPQTSHDAIPSEASLSRTKSALLAIYAQHGDGLTAREAGRLVGHPEAWKRVSDLTRDGFLIPTGETRRDPDTNRSGRVLIINKGA